MAATTKREKMLPEEEVRTFTSGSCLLDKCLGGGWGLGRVINIVGDNSTGKTLLAIEATANFAQAFPDCAIRYFEAEAAFDLDYAESLGLPIDKVSFVEADPEDDSADSTVEHWYEDFTKFLEDNPNPHQPKLYILDSMDALSDRSEADRAIDGTSYGANKAKKLSEIFRRLVVPAKKHNVTIIIVSQVRENIGMSYGPKYTRSGGKALDFYSSQIVWLAQKKKVERTRKNIKRVVAITVEAHCKKNKIGPPHRKCLFRIEFGYGIEDLITALEFITECKELEQLDGYTATQVKQIIQHRYRKLSNDEYDSLLAKANALACELWEDIESEACHTRTKYGSNEEVDDDLDDLDDLEEG